MGENEKCKLENIVKKVIGDQYNKMWLESGGVFENIGVNSVNYIKIIVSAESEFGIEFEDENLDLKKFCSFNDLLFYICEKCKEL